MPGNITTRTTFSPLLAPDIGRVLLETGRERPLEYPLWCNVREMLWNPIRDQQMAGLGAMPPKPEGTLFALDQPLQGGTVSYLAVAFGLACEFTWEAWRDELYGIFREMAREMMRSSRFRQEVDAHAALNAAFSGTTFLGTDGATLCSTSHTGDDGVTRSNRPNPDIGFSITGIQNGIVSFEGTTNERNLPQALAPVMALITPSNRYIAREILGSSGKPYTADNEINALVEDDMSWLVDHYITTATNWFLLAARGIHDINFLWRDHPMFDHFDDPWTKNAVFTAYQREVPGFGLWRGVFGSTG